MKLLATTGIVAALLLAPLGVTKSALAAPTADGPLLAMRRAFFPEFRAQIRADAAVAPRLLREFWDANKDQKAEVLLATSVEAAQILWATNRSEPDRAIDLLDLIVQRFPNNRARFDAIEAKAEILRRANRLDEAAQLLEAAWPQVQSRNLDRFMLPILSERIEVLRAQQKPEQAIELLHQTLQSTPPLANWMNFYRLMFDAQTDAGHAEQALRWAGLYFRVALYKEDDMARATSALTRAWLANKQPDKPALFAAAQSATDAPNPLQEVAFPILPVAAKTALQQRLNNEAEQEASPSRVAMYLLSVVSPTLQPERSLS